MLYYYRAVHHYKSIEVILNAQNKSEIACFLKEFKELVRQKNYRIERWVKSSRNLCNWVSPELI